MREKHCSKCDSLLPETTEFFHREKRAASGFKSHCKTCALNWSKKYLSSEKGRNKKAEYRQQTRDHIRKYKRNWERNRAKSHPEFRIKNSLRNRIRSVLIKQGESKNKRTAFLIGCSLEYFIAYIQSKFKDGMTLDNYGEWHIDHIKPCCSFDLSNPEEQRKCFHYTNLQPLWANENLRKGGKF